MPTIVKTGFWYDGDGKARRCVEEGLGDFVVGVIKAEEAALCRGKKVHFLVPDVHDHGTFGTPGPYIKMAPEEDRNAWGEDPAERIRQIREAGGDFYAGQSVLHEYAGRIYWPREYLEPETADSPGGREGSYRSFPPARDLLEAKRIYLADLKKVVAQDRKNGGAPLALLCSAAMHKYHIEVGIDIPGLEIFPGDAYLHFSALRGASRAYGKNWIAANAAQCQAGGANLDAIFFKRHKLCLLYSYLAGADVVLTQYGAFALWVRRLQSGVRDSFKGSKNRLVLKHRKVVTDFHEFCQSHPRPKGGPKVALGIVHGNLDGNAGLWTPWVWGQRGGDEWKHGDPESGWDYLDDFHRRAPWHCRTLEGKTDFSGNPPYGQYDIVPVEAPLTSLKKYRCLVFLGWNTMTSEIYDKLKAFVRAGGHLVMAVPHLSTQTRRGAPIRLYKRGDYRDLFGVVVKGKGPTVMSGHKFAPPAYENYRFPEWGTSDPLFINGEYPLARVELKGAHMLCRSSSNYNKPEMHEAGPVLTEHRLGKGRALLITSWCYPGHRPMNLLMKQILRDLSTFEQGRIKLSGSDKIRYAVYEEKGLTTVYLLNTDFEVSNVTNLWIGNMVIPEVSIPSCEMRIAHIHKGCCAIPHDRSVHVEHISGTGNCFEVTLMGRGPQAADVYGLRTPVTRAKLNGKAVLMKPIANAQGVTLQLSLSRKKNVLSIC